MRPIHLALRGFLLPLLLGPALSAAEPAAIKIAVPPMYPPLAQIARVGGTVEVDVLLDASGRVKSIKESRVNTQFRSLVPNAEWVAKKWIFESGYELPLTITFQYKLLPPDADRLNSEYGTYFIPPRTVLVVGIASQPPERTSGGL